MSISSDPLSATTPSAFDITDVAALEACVGAPTFRAGLKVIDHIDTGAAHWLSVSPLGFIAFCQVSASLSPAGFVSGQQAADLARATEGAAPVAMTLAGGTPGFARVESAQRLALPLSSLDQPSLAEVGARVGSVFLAPGVGETLRINGRVVAVDNPANGTLDSAAVHIDVDECYIHCAKSLIRSDFWQVQPRERVAPELEAFVAASTFMALATFDGVAGADVSPKGDPAGSMIRLAMQGDQQVLSYAERPGNKRADSFRNILRQPQVAVLALIPGTDQIATLTGSARLSSDPALRETWIVANKTPSLVASISIDKAQVSQSAALARANLWPVKRPPDAPNAAQILVGHISIHRDQSEEAQQVKAAVAVPGQLEKGLVESYRNNLY